jgi:hypothetical protein
MPAKGIQAGMKAARALDAVFAGMTGARAIFCAKALPAFQEKGWGEVVKYSAGDRAALVGPRTDREVMNAGGVRLRELEDHAAGDVLRSDHRALAAQ